MFSIMITEKGGPTSSREFDQPEVTIGRVQGNDIVLPKSNISKRHARLINNDGSFVVIDSKSTNGTYINGKRIDAPYDLNAGDKIFVGDFTLEVNIPAAHDVEDSLERATKPPPPPSNNEEEDDLLNDDEWGASNNVSDEWEDDWSKGDPQELAREDSVPQRRSRDKLDDVLSEPSSPRVTMRGRVVKDKVVLDSSLHSGLHFNPAEVAVLRQFHKQLLACPNLQQKAIAHLDGRALNSRIKDAIREAMKSVFQEEPADGADAKRLAGIALEEAQGWGPLEDLVKDEAVSKILVNGPQHVFVEVDGNLRATERTFSCAEALLGTTCRQIASVGHTLDQNNPIVDVRLNGGMRLQAIASPLAVEGPVLTLRKPLGDPLLLDDLVAHGTLTASMAHFLETCVKAHQNILLSGTVGSGRTTSLNVIASYIPIHERIVTIEDIAELVLEHENVVRLETHPSLMNGTGDHATRHLISSALRIQPDRILFGDCRGPEAWELLCAMRSGPKSLMTTLQAASPREAISRIEAMVSVGRPELSVDVVRRHIADAVDIIVHHDLFADGTRKVTNISEVVGTNKEGIALRPIFTFERNPTDEAGVVSGRHSATGDVPEFYETLKALGLEADLSLFQE